jgi:hypothetical protein
LNGASDAEQEHLIACLQERLRLRRATKRICKLWRIRTKQTIAKQANNEKLKQLKKQDQQSSSSQRSLGRSIRSRLFNKRNTNSAEEEQLTTTPVLEVATQISYHEIKYAKEAFMATRESNDMGYVVLVEKCFVLTDVPDGQQSLLFCALQQIINREREARPAEN